VTASPYVLKEQPQSSHSILLDLVPNDGRGRRLLDVGCAGGYLSRVFAQRGYNVCAIDGPWAQPRALPANVVFIEQDLEAGLPRLEGGFDYVIAADVLEHLRDPERLLRQIRSCMTPGGTLLASLPNSANVFFRLNVLLGRFPQDDRGLFDRTHLHFFTWKTWNELLNRAGFRITSVRPSVIPFSVAFPGFPALGGALESVYAVFARAWKKLFAYQFVVTAEITGVADQSAVN